MRDALPPDGDSCWSEAADLAKHYFLLRKTAARWRSMAIRPEQVQSYYSGLSVAPGSVSRLARTFQQNALRAEAEADALRENLLPSRRPGTWSQYY